MSKQIQAFKLYQLLRSDLQIPTERIATELGVNVKSVPVYINKLKEQFKANIESIRKGKKVIAYKILNADQIRIQEFRKGTAVPKNNASKAINSSLADELESVNTGTPSEKDISEIKSQLGLDTVGYRAE
jgi:hypothetical protein